MTISKKAQNKTCHILQTSSGAKILIAVLPRKKPSSLLQRLIYRALSFIPAALLALFPSFVAAGPVVAPTQLPTSGQVVAGKAAITQQNAQMNITQSSQSAIVNWGTFNIGSQAGVNFSQPNAASVVLNRVLSSDPSYIYGNLTANGQVFLLNQSGILFGQGASINVGGFVASTLNIQNSDFLSGNYHFTRDGASGSIVNQGNITAANGGYVALLAPNISNQGTITANMGTIALAAGDAVTLDLSGENLLSVTVDPSTVQTLIENKQLLQANGGQVILTSRAADKLLGSAINNGGTIEANAMQNVNGEIVLDAGNGSTNVEAGSAISATGRAGGKIEVLGDQVNVSGQISASGSNGGGTIDIGGGWQGSGNLPQATSVSIANTATLDASATNSGNGGTVVVWSDVTNPYSQTRVYGTLLAQGGPNGGDGGRIETSGHWLDVSGVKVNASAPKGSGGSWLLDPYDITIGTGTDTSANSGTNPITYTGTTSGSLLLASTVSNALTAGTSVIVDTSGAGSDAGSITVASAIVASPSSNVNLTLKANRDININAMIESTGNPLDVILTADQLHTGTGNVNINSTITTNNANIVINGGNTVTVSSAGYLNTGNIFGAFGGSSSVSIVLTSPTSVINIANNGTNNLINTGGISTGGGLTFQAGTINVNGNISAGSSFGAAILTASTGGITEGSGGSITANSLTTSSVGGTTLNGANAVLNFSGTNTTSGNISLNDTAATLNITGLSQSGGGAMTITDNGTINVNNDVAWSANKLTLNALNNISIDSNLTGSGTASLALLYDQGTVASGNLISFNLTTGSKISLPAGPNFSTTMGSNAVVTNYTVVTSLGAAADATTAPATTTLQGIAATSNLSGNFVLGSDIDASVTSGWNAGAGFTPIGTSSIHPYTGVFRGFGHTVSNLYINLPLTSDIGLFGYINSSAVIRHVGLVGGSVSGNSYVGALVGVNNGGTVIDAYSTGTVTGVNAGNEVGGLVGSNYGTISNSHSSATVSGTHTIGGLTGYNSGTTSVISGSFASGPVNGTSYSIGGLAGASNGTISNSYASGNVTGTANNNFGGLVGYNTGAISNSYASGNVNATSNYIGGLVGENSGGTISNTYALGSVSGTGSNDVGGLVGYNYGSGVITTSYATGGAIGSSVAGGLVGNNSATVSNSYWDSSVNATGIASGTTTGATGVLASNMQTASSFTGLTFTTTPGAAGNNWVIVDADGTLNNASGAAGATFPMLASEYSTSVTNAHQLQLMEMALTVNYDLNANINALATGNGKDVWGSSGFVPIGSKFINPNFSGTFYGQGYTISNLTINMPTNNGVGLFGAISATSQVRRVGLIGGSVTGGSYVGELVGASYGLVINSYATGSVNGMGVCIGGLVGCSGGTISNSYATGSVSGASYIGGLVGISSGTVSNSYAAGNVNGSGHFVGGLVGLNYIATISNSYAMGSVTGTGSNYVGGLVGGNYGNGVISVSYATGSVSGSSAAGGLVGINAGTISTSYWNSSVNTTGIASGTTTGATGVLASNMQTASSFTGFNFTSTPGAAGNNWVIVDADGTLNNNNGTSGATFPMLASEYSTSINNAHQLQLMEMNLAGSYTLNANINAAATASGKDVWGASGFVPVGNFNNGKFTGSFDGQGHTIVSLFMNWPTTNNVGLFGVVGTNAVINNVGLSGGSVSGNSYVGGLAGQNYGTIKNSYNVGSVTGNGTVAAGTGQAVGGLVGQNYGTISGSHATGSVSGASYVGGLVGHNYGDGITNNLAVISNSYATGSVSGTKEIGGLVGKSDGSLSNSFYNAETVSLNGFNINTGAPLTAGGIYLTQYQDWFIHGETLNITNYSATLPLVSTGIYGVSSIQGLKDMLGFAESNNAALTFKLTSGIDLSGTGGPGFYVPYFAATFNGNSNTLSNLNVSASGTDLIGMFGFLAGTVTNLGVTGVNVTGNVGVGGLAGGNGGTISNSYVTGSVNGAYATGGLVGFNDGTLKNAFYDAATVSINGQNINTGAAIVAGGLYDTQYQDWISHSETLSIANYAATLPSVSTGVYGVSSVQGLKDMLGFAEDPTLNFKLTSSVNLNGVSGFYIPYFAGTFNGNNNTLSNFSINLPTTPFVGMFGLLAGSVSNLGVTNVTVTGGWVSGGLVGANFGSISNAYATGAVTGNDGDIGGLAGGNKGSISNSFATVNVTGSSTNNDNTGGLTGGNGGTISNSYATGNVSGHNHVGGLSGGNYGTILNSYATGSVSGTGNNVGGLAGHSHGTISNSYATGNVTGVGQVGGLAGSNDGNINTSYATGNVSGSTTNNYYDTGGLVGINNGTVINDYASGSVSGGYNVGGLVGHNYNTISDSYATGSVVGSLGQEGGLVGFNDGTISTVYSTGSVSGPNSIGGLVGWSNGTVTNGYWDTDTSGQSVSQWGGGATTLQFMQGATASASTGFNFTTTPGATGNNWVMVDANGTLNNASGATGATFPMLASEYSTTIGNVHQLQLMQMALGASYTLGANVNAVATGNVKDIWFSSTFVPIGNSTTPFTGTFDGLGHTISNLTINQPNNLDVGLFGDSSGIIRNVGLVSGSITGNQYVGGLVGYNGGSVSNSYTTGNVSGNLYYIGGLVGWNNGTVGSSYTTGIVSGGGQDVGGLVGYNHNTVSNSYALGQVSGGAYCVGGLVGNSVGTVNNSYANGNVSGVSYAIGGLIGQNGGTINNSYATGSALSTTSGQVGGLVGYNGGTISNSYATGSVSGNSQLGGLVGYDYNYGTPGIINNSFWDKGTTNQAHGADGSIGIADSFGLTTSQMMQLASFSSWNTTTPNTIAATGGSGAVWRIYQGHTAPLLTSFLTPLTLTGAPDVTVTYDGSAHSGASITPPNGVLGSAATGTAAGIYNGYYSTQQGYDVSGGNLTINPLTVVVTLAGQKVYDGTTTFATGQLAISDIFGTDQVSLSAGTANASSKNAGTWSLTSFTGLALTGSSASNYTLTGVSGSGKITPLALTGSIATGGSVYGATYVPGTVNFTNAIQGDNLGTATVFITTQGNTSSSAHLKVGSYTGIESVQSLTGTDAGNYTFVGVIGNYTVTPATITSVTGVTATSKVYDGTTAATLNTANPGFTGMVAGDNLTVTAASGAFSDANVGTAKTVNLSGITLGGTDVGNYILSGNSTTTANITQLASVTWTGSTSGNWSNASNWAGGALPVGSNVAAVILPSNSNVTYDTAMSNTTLASLSSAGSLVLTGNNLSIGSLSLTGGGVTGTGTLTVTNSFSQSGGATIAMTGAASANITQASGNLTLVSLSAPTVNLTASTGAITQTGPIVATALNTVSATGTTLTDTGNQIGGFNATNMVSGDITLINTASPLTVTGISNTGGGNDIVSNTGAISITGTIAAGGGSVILTASGANGMISESGSGLVSTTGELSTNSIGGTALGGANTIGNSTLTGSFFASNSTSGDVSLTNTGKLDVVEISNVPGWINVSNTGAVTVGPMQTLTGTSQISVTGNTVTIAAHSPLTINGGISAQGNVVLTAGATNGGTTDTLTINSQVASSAGSVSLAAGNSIAIADPSLVTAALGVTEQANQNATNSVSQTQAGNVITSVNQVASKTVGNNNATAPNNVLLTFPSVPGNDSITQLGANPLAIATNPSPTITVAAPAPVTASSDSTNSIATPTASGSPDSAIVTASSDSTNSIATDNGSPATTASGTGEAKSASSGSAVTAVNVGAILAQLAAEETARHQARTELYKEALQILKDNPSAADIPTCGKKGGGKKALCIPDAAKFPIALPSKLDAREAAGRTGPYKPNPPVHKVAIMIGNNTYSGGIPSLETPVHDVESIGEVLKDKMGYEVNVVRNATKKDVVSALKSVAEKLTTNDSVLIFYAGHGYEIDETKQGFWIPTDASTSDPKTWISNSDIAKLLRVIPAKQIILVSDSCFSGTLTQEQEIFTEAASKKELVLTKRSVVALSSGGEEPVSDAGKEGHSIFAYYFLKELQNIKGQTTSKQLHDSVEAAVRKDFPQDPQVGGVVSAGHAPGGDYLIFEPNKAIKAH